MSKRTYKRLRSVIITLFLVMAIDVAISYASNVPMLPDPPRPKSNVPMLPDPPRPKSNVPMLPDPPRP